MIRWIFSIAFLLIFQLGNASEEVAVMTSGGYPKGVAVSKDGLIGYVTRLDTNSVSVIDLKTKKEIDAIEVGESPVAISLSSDEKKGYVANMEGGTVSVIDLESRKVSKTIHLGKDPVSIDLFGSRGYVTNLKDGSVDILNLDHDCVVKSVITNIIPRGIGLAFLKNFSLVDLANFAREGSFENWFTSLNQAEEYHTMDSLGHWHKNK